MAENSGIRKHCSYEEKYEYKVIYKETVSHVYLSPVSLPNLSNSFLKSLSTITHNHSNKRLPADTFMEGKMSSFFHYTVIRSVWVSAKFGTCTVVSVNGTLVEDKMRRFTGECEHFSFNNCPIYTDDGASAKFSTNSHDTVNSESFYTTLGVLIYYKNGNITALYPLPPYP